MILCKFCSKEIPSEKAIELNDPEVVLVMNFLRINYQALVNEQKNSVVCSRCMNSMKINYSFIMLCTKTESKLRKFRTHNRCLGDTYLDLKKLLEYSNGICIPQNKHLCRICLREITEFFFNPKERCDTLLNSIEEMLKICVPSLDLSITEEPKICGSCVNSLVASYAFHENNISLFKTSRTTARTIMGSKQISGGDYATESNVKKEVCDQDTEICEEVVMLPNVIYVKQEPLSLDINEEVKLEDSPDPYPNMLSADGSRPYKPVTKHYFCQTCSYTTKRKACLIKHKVVHFPDYKKPIFKCKDCGYTVKSQKYLDRHMQAHANGIDFKKFKCDTCSFSTKKRSKLERHMTVHKDEREAVMYKCSKCMFITKWKSYLAQHELTHNESEVKKFQCKECDFSTNWRGSLLQHRVVHLSGDDAFKFSCEHCSFKTKRKDNLSKHMIRHMKDEDVRIFYCSECPFTSKFSSKLSRHMHVHKQGDELTTYSCTECNFQTRWKNNLQQHMRVHQDASEINVFKCKDCPFTTKWKTCLTEHEVMHKTGDDSKEYKCTECSFNTKWKKSLNMHLLTHTTDESVKKFKCAICEYKTYRSHHLKRHMQVHYK